MAPSRDLRPSVGNSAWAVDSVTTPAVGGTPAGPDGHYGVTSTFQHNDGHALLEGQRDGRDG